MTSDPASPANHRRILLVSYHYGPNTETGGFRWTNMIPGLVRHGWEFDIITLDRPVDYGPIGSAGIPAGGPVEVFPVGIPAWADRVAQAGLWTVDAIASVLRGIAPRAAASNGAARSGAATVDPAAVHVVRRGDRAGVRANVAQGLVGLSDAARQRGWTQAAIALGLSLIRRRNHRLVVVSSPPHSTQQVGVELARLTGTPFIADFRDPWYYGIGVSRENTNPIHRRLGRRTEPVINRRAAVVVHNTQEALDAVGADIADASVRRVAIPNGYDDTGPAAPPDPDRFIVAFTGVLHPWMDVRVIFAACRRFRQRHPDAPLVIRFMGTEPEFGGVGLTGLAAAYGLGDCFELRPRSTRADAFALQESAAIAVAFDCTHPLCIPTKFYDYARLCGNMLLLGHTDGAMAAAAGRIGVRVHAMGDDPAIDATLDEAFRRWRQGEMTTPADPSGLFDRRLQIEAWDRLLHSVAAPAPAGGA